MIVILLIFNQQIDLTIVPVVKSQCLSTWETPKHSSTRSSPTTRKIEGQDPDHALAKSNRFQAQPPRRAPKTCFHQQTIDSDLPPYESDNLAVRCSLLYLKSSLLSRPTVSRSSLQQAPSKSIIIFVSPIHYQLWITQTYAVATSVKFCNSTKSRSYGFHKLICTTAKKNFTRSRSIFDRLNNTRQLALVDFFLIFPEQRRLHAFWGYKR